MGALPRPDVPEGPVRALFDALHALHHRAGWPSLRVIAREVGCSHTTVSAAFAGPRVPRWGLLELIVETLHGDVDHFHRLWLATSGVPAPVQPAQGVPRQLPADVAGFTGRDGQLADLDRLVSAAGSGPVVISAVSGTAGVGKTALAVHWAHRVANRFPDGHLYINLRGYDPDKPVEPSEALETMLRTLLPDGTSIPHDLAGRAARYRTTLTGRKMLVLLDNAHSTAQVRDLLPGAGSSLVLVTSRDALPGLVARHGAVRVNLDLLSLDEAVDLLRTLLGSRVDAEPTAATELARRCARLPLALRIAAEMAMARPRATLAELVAELGDNTRRLDLLAAGDDEYTAVRAVFSWSCRNLSAAEDRAFRLLGLPPCAQIGVDAVAALLGADQATAHRLVDALCRVHLVEETTAARFGMHDLLRAYAAEQVTDLPETEREAAMTRLSEYFVDAAEQASAADDAGARAWLDLERSNLLAVAKADPRIAIRLSDALAGYLDIGAHYADALTMHELARDVARSTGDQAAEANALNLLGVVRRRLGDYSTAAEHHNAALAIHSAIGNAAGRATALHGLGTVSWRCGRYLEGRDHLHEALALWVEIGDQAAQGTVLYGLGTVHLQLGEYRAALAHHKQALDIHRATGNRLGESRTLNNLGAAYERLGALAEAQDNYQRSLALSREIGNQLGVAVALTNLGSTFTRLGQFEDALAHHAAALPIYRSAGYRVGEADAMCGLGILYSRSGKTADALKHLRRAVEIAQDVGEVDVETAAEIAIGDTLRADGQTSEAHIHYETAIKRTAITQDRYGHAAALLGLARLHRMTNNEPEARTAAEHALRLYTELSLPHADEVRAFLDDVSQPS